MARQNVMTASKNRMGRKSPCPVCKQPALVPILYGPLPDSLIEDRDRGDLFWGGLTMKRDSPRWKCGACHRSFRSDTG